MGFSSDEIKDSLMSNKYDEVMATYLLLDDKRVSALVKIISMFDYVYHIVKKQSCYYLPQICKKSAYMRGLSVSSAV